MNILEKEYIRVLDGWLGKWDELRHHQLLEIDTLYKLKIKFWGLKKRNSIVSLAANEHLET